MSKRKCLSIKEKKFFMRWIKEEGKGYCFKIWYSSEQLIKTIIKIRNNIQNYDSSNSCSKCLKTCVYEDVDEAISKWIHTMRDKNVPISGPFIIEKVLQFAKALGYDEFRGSNGWLEKFKRRHGIIAKVISGERK
ncbi:hypothetical protein AVEN_179996-1 [Araneus ventricosus]|uniref:HTH CENPB-type domain-containing protein n=1 Tax=Araneus ventricosus TaxID=182803 RepID=A0A4Y2MAK4_ARAVE|nr:hypothetical protein AVEN_179996-1 [Araneus ventricosus]